MVDSSKVTAFITALASKFENKTANKKDTITGDFSSDSASYPTVKAVKNFFGTKVTSWGSTTSDSNYPSEKLVKTALDGKASSTHSHTKSEITDFPSTMTPSSHTHGNLQNNGQVGSTAQASKPVMTDANGKITTGSFGTSSGTFCQGNDSRLSDARTPTAHNQASTTITEASALSNIGTSANATQSAVNSAINTAIGTLQGIKAIQVVATKPTASADTMNKLYIVSENSKVNVYYTSQSGSSYSWKKMDTDILDELSISWNDVTGKPDSFTPASHTHGSVTNDGKIGSASGKIITTGTGGVLQASASITKSMISDFPSSMTPSSHTHGDLTNDGKIGSASGKPIITTTGGKLSAGSFGTSSGTFAEGNHTHNYTTTSDVDTEIEAYLDAITTALTS